MTRAGITNRHRPTRSRLKRPAASPLLLPYRTSTDLVSQYIDLLDGILFTGGNDLDPALYNDTLHPRAEPIDPARQTFELALIAEVEKRSVPALGICLGSQLMNVHRGGSLTQYLPDRNDPDQIEHRKLNVPSRRHDAIVDLDSRLGRFIGKSHLSVNTAHKQAVARLGQGLKIIARSPDGVVEGFEDPKARLFAAVQWHPERLHDEPEHLAPFKLLVEEASKSH